MFILFLILLGPLLFNAGREIYLWLKIIFPKINKAVYTYIFSMLVGVILVLFFLSMAKVTWIPGVVFKINSFVLGFFIYSMIFVNVASFLLFLGKVTNLLNSETLKKARLLISGVCLLLANVLMAYGTFNTLDVKTKEYSITINTTNIKTDTLKIALISDLHLGYIYDDSRVSEIVTTINSMDVDVVCMAGDIFDGDYITVANKDKIKTLFKSIESTYGVYASLGNHDAGNTYDDIVNFLKESNINLLRDEYEVIDNRFILVGRRDSSPIGKHDTKREESITINNPKDLPVIVMDHQPGNINEYDNSVDLILCGHTHQGQFFPLNIFTDLVYDVDYGYYQASNYSPQVIVTSGVGSWGPPQRIGTNSEIVEINISIN